jgi:hypothetical protein
MADEEKKINITNRNIGWAFVSFRRKARKLQMELTSS